MDPASHVAAIERQGAVLISAAERAGLAAPVPSCPAWQVRDLLRHLGYVHRWAAGYVGQQLCEAGPGVTEAEQLAGGPPDSELLDWFRAGQAALVQTLGSAGPDVQCWTFLPAPTPLAFWARRQAHETAIHGADAQLAAGDDPAYPPALAADGIDELLLAFFGRDGSEQDSTGPDAAARDGASRWLGFRTTDTGHQWWARIAAGSSRTEYTGRGPAPGPAADCEVAGPASSLYRLLWRRTGSGPADITITGSEQLLRDWQSGIKLVWA